MTPPLSAAALALAAMTTLLPALAQAECRTAGAGARCILAISPPVRPERNVETVAMSSASAASPLLDVGQIVPRGEYSIVLNAEYYGLPPVSDGWVYMRVGPDAYRVDWQTHQVLERVTDKAAANF